MSQSYYYDYHYRPLQEKEFNIMNIKGSKERPKSEKQKTTPPNILLSPSQDNRETYPHLKGMEKECYNREIPACWILVNAS